MQLVSDEISDIYLQSITLDDVTPNYVQWLNDPKVNQYLETRFTKQKLDSVNAFVKDILKQPNEHLFTIRTKADNQHIGNIKVGHIDPVHNVGYVSLFIGDKNSWGKGFAVQAIQLISRYALERLLLRKLIASAYKPNIASINAFLKVGYQHECVLKSHYLLNGKPCDIILTCLFNDNLDILPSIL